jgi:hypothetical protein
MKSIKLLSNFSRKEISLREDVYQSISDFILSKIRESGEVSLDTLLDDALHNKSIKFEQNLGWCLLQVKGDLEARGIVSIEVKKGLPNRQSIKLKKKPRSIVREV